MLNKIAGHQVDRRLLLKGAAAGGLGIAGATMLAGCAPAASGPMSFGARTVDEAPTKLLEALVAAYTAKSGNEVGYNATESNAFQNNLSQYLQGTPDDCFQWMAGYRMQFFADQGLLEDVSDVWDVIGSQYSESHKIASSGLDGKQYFVPQSLYPWGLHFRKSMMAEIGMNPEDLYNWDDFMGALEELKGQGLVPLAAANKGGWEAMGTFDMLNARLNGYQFHVDLLGGREKWTDDRVKEVFRHWEMLLPYQNTNVLDLEWDGAMQLLLQKQAGFFQMGSWFGENFKEQSDEDYADLMIIPWPEMNPDHGRDTVDAPLDGFCVASNGGNPSVGKDFIKFAGDMEGVQAMLDTGVPMTSANKGQDTSAYDEFQLAQQAVISEAKYLTFFLDRDTRPDFATPSVGPAFQAWFKDPSSTDSILESLQSQWDALPAL
jgi:multiple sugar transport system substrate-binding protein